jgi:hypothetical protein
VTTFANFLKAQSTKIMSRAAYATIYLVIPVYAVSTLDAGDSQGESRAAWAKRALLFFNRHLMTDDSHKPGQPLARQGMTLFGVTDSAIVAVQAKQTAVAFKPPSC